MTSEFIVDVSEADFEYQVLAYSQQIPVLVDFWAEWCAPCRVLSPILEALAEEYRGGFRLAKVNIDNNSNLATRYMVRSIPAVKAFRDGRMVAEFLGAQPEPRVREFLRNIAPSQDDLLVAKGNYLLETGQTHQAEATFRQILEKTPNQAPALLGLAKAMLMVGNSRDALHILHNFPASREFQKAEALTPLATALEHPFFDAEYSDEPLQAAYINAIHLVQRGNIEAALDGLLDILRVDKRYRDGEVRLVYLAILELLGENNPLTKQYRQELASALF
jgi:putative thioredoxin